ncbi:MAG: hypothetical protein LC685_04775 [Actinobacteria bacterium]|nr:hypothetical protein [Actinomycetota bacterium]
MISSLRRVAPVLALGALCGAALGACGTDSSTNPSGARRVLEQSFKATSTALRSGRLDARLQLEPEGLLAIAGPISLDVKGPIVRPESGGLPRADLTAVATVAGQRYTGGVVSDGEHAFLKLDGKAYRLGDKRSGNALKSLGLDPSRWLRGTDQKANVRVAGTDTLHVSGTVDAARLLNDLGDLVPATMRAQLAAAVKSADFELWAGADDKILRQLVLRISFKVADGAKPPIPGLDAGKIQLRARLDDVNGAPPAIKAPANGLPLSKVPADRGLGGLIGCLSGGTDIARCVTALRP